MINKITKWVISSFCEIDAEEQAVIEYGLVQGLYSMCGIGIVLLIGTILEITMESVFFLATLIPLRMYAGGYHASTRTRCAIVSLTLMIGSLGIIRYWEIPLIVSIAIGLAEAGMLFCIIPIGGTEPLDKDETKTYRKKGRKILVLEVLFFVLTLNSFNEVFIATFSVVLILVVLGMLKKDFAKRGKLFRFIKS